MGASTQPTGCSRHRPRGLENCATNWPEIYRACSLQLPPVQRGENAHLGEFPVRLVRAFPGWQLRSFQAEAKQDVGRSARMAIAG